MPLLISSPTTSIIPGGGGGGGGVLRILSDGDDRMGGKNQNLEKFPRASSKTQLGKVGSTLHGFPPASLVSFFTLPRLDDKGVLGR